VSAPSRQRYIDTQSGKEVEAYQITEARLFASGPDVRWDGGNSYSLWDGKSWQTVAPGHWVVGKRKSSGVFTNAAFVQRFTAVPAPGLLTQQLEAIAKRGLSANYGRYSDGVEYWLAAPAYQSPFVADIYFALEGFPEYFRPEQILAWSNKIIAKRDGSGNLPIALIGSDATPLYYSGCDNLHNAVTGDGNLLLARSYQWYWDETGEIGPFNAVKTYLRAAFDTIARNPTTGLVTVDDGAPWVPWGFNDNAKHTGDVLTGSLFYYQAASALAVLYTIAGDVADAAEMTSRADAISAGLDGLWNAGAGMYNAGTVKNAQIDVLGSAFALYLGLPDASKKSAISSYLVSNYATLTSSGYVRQSPSEWGAAWACSFSSGAYDNGYWSVGHLWVATALAYTDPQQAEQLIVDYLASPDPSREWIGVGQGAAFNLASPMGALRYARLNNL
jgi:hypothetical protein